MENKLILLLYIKIKEFYFLNVLEIFHTKNVLNFNKKKTFKKSPIKQASDGKLNLINLLKSLKYKEEINIDYSNNPWSNFS